MAMDPIQIRLPDPEGTVDLSTEDWPDTVIAVLQTDHYARNLGRLDAIGLTKNDVIDLIEALSYALVSRAAHEVFERYDDIPVPTYVLNGEAEVVCD